MTAPSLTGTEMAFVKRSAIAALGNAAMGDEALPNRAVIQRNRQAQMTGSPNDTGIEAAAVSQVLKRMSKPRPKRK
jgi:hypothetical protein